MGIAPLARRGVPWRQPRFGTRVLMGTRMSLNIVAFAVNIVPISLRLIETRTRIVRRGKLHPGFVNFWWLMQLYHCLHITLCIPLKALTDADADQRR